MRPLGTELTFSDTDEEQCIPSSCDGWCIAIDDPSGYVAIDGTHEFG
jgi:hypothetical protein